MIDPNPPTIAEGCADELRLALFQRLVEATAPTPADVMRCRCLRCVYAVRYQPPAELREAG